MTVRAVTSEPEVFVGRREMARLMGVSVRTLDGMVRRGEVPSVTWGMRTRRFLASEVFRVLEARERARRMDAA